MALVEQQAVAGLQAGDVVITSNMESLFEGAAVKVGQWDDGS